MSEVDPSFPAMRNGCELMEFGRKGGGSYREAPKYFTKLQFSEDYFVDDSRILFTTFRRKTCQRKDISCTMKFTQNAFKINVLPFRERATSGNRNTCESPSDVAKYKLNANLKMSPY